MKKTLLLLCALVGTGSAATAQDVDIERLGKAKKFDWSGNIGTNASFYTASGIENRSSPFSYNLYANFNVKVLDTWDLPFAFTYSKTGSSVTKPFYQFGISPQYKWARLHLGHRNLSFNPYTLAGHTFFGAGVELNPGKFRFGAMYGRLQEAIAPDTNTGTFAIPAFKRTGYAFKIGVGSAENFVDLTLFHGKDDTGSVRPLGSSEEAMLPQAFRPAENLAVGLSVRQLIAKKIRFSVDVGASAYNRNVRDTDFARDFGIFRYNASSQLNWAGKASLGYVGKNFGISADYERVMPDYTTMGSYFFNNDFENYTLSPTGHTADGKLSFTASAGLQRNNLSETRAQTSQRFIGNANLTYNPQPNWGASLSYNNFVVNQTAGTVPLSDSIRIRQINQTISFCPYYTINRDTAVSHSFTFCANFQNVNDRNVLTRQYGNMNTYVFSLSHATSFLSAGNAISSGLNYNIIQLPAVSNTQMGATVGYSHPLLEKQLNLNSTLNYNLSFIDGAQDGSIVNVSLGGSYTAAERHTFSLNYNFIRTASEQYQGYVEQLGSLSYNLRLK